MAGFFITFEGGEGCGKSTQVGLLAQRLRAEGWPVRELREPGGTPLAESIRILLKHSPAGTGMTAETELLLMNAARAQLVREIIRPALAAGEVVVCDRFYDSTTAYQGWGRQMDLEQVRAVIDLAVGPTRPNLTILLRLSPELGAKRRLGRELAFPGDFPDRFEEAGPAFFERVDQGFESIAEQEPERVRRLDATPPVAAVHESVWRLVASVWKDRGGGVIPGHSQVVAPLEPV